MGGARQRQGGGQRKEHTATGKTEETDVRAHTPRRTLRRAPGGRGGTPPATDKLATAPAGRLPPNPRPPPQLWLVIRPDSVPADGSMRTLTTAGTRAASALASTSRSTAGSST